MLVKTSVTRNQMYQAPFIAACSQTVKPIYNLYITSI